MIRLFDSPIAFASTTSPSPARKAAPIRHRFFEGAAVSHLTEDFDGGSASLDGELRMSLRTLRKRARNLERNNGSMGRFLEICRANLIGQGIRLQSSAKSRSGEQDTDLNRKIEAGWKEWGRKENASASGRQTFSDLENFLVTSLKRDGEAIFQKVYRGKWGFQLRPIDPAYLDETFSERLPNGNRIIMSVEIDDFERPVAYWLRTPYENLFSRQESRPVERVRIPAEQILHIFYSTDAAQVRGVPPIAPVLFELRQLGGYKQAEVVAARVAASKMGFYKKPPVENDAYSGDGDDDENKVTAPTEEMEPGSFYELPDGWDFQSFNPEHPTTAFGQFVSSALRGIAAGLNVSYEEFAGDLSQVNFSSARIGALIQQKIWRRIQQFLTDHFHEEVYAEWLRAAALTRSVELTAEEVARAARPRWMPPGWAYANPKQEIDADVTAVENCLDTRSNILADRGLDFHDVLEKLAEEQKAASQLGVSLSPVTNTSTANDPSSPVADSDN